MSQLRASKITGIGSGFPKHAMTNHELVQKLAEKGIETSHEWIHERTGINERRISRKGEAADTNSAIAYRASLAALEMAGKKAEDIDQILFATCSPETPIPSTACWLQEKLGAKNAFAVDINAACSGFIFALSMADQYIKSGASKCSLIVGSEVLSPLINWDDRTSCILFGDGAGAAIVEPTVSPSRKDAQIYSTHLHADGTLWELFHIPAGGSRLELTPALIEAKQGKMMMKGKEIFRVATRTLAEFAETALKANGFSVNELDWMVPHQANLRIIEAVANRLNFPMEKVILNIDRFGNTSAATVPTAFDEAVRNGKIKHGDLVLFDVFGAGLTYGSALIRW